MSRMVTYIKTLTPKNILKYMHLSSLQFDITLQPHILSVCQDIAVVISVWQSVPYHHQNAIRITFDINLNLNIKACVRYFLSNFYFSLNDSPSKTMKNVFLFHRKSSFRFRDIQFFVIFSLPFYTFQIQKDKQKWNNLLCNELTCINLQMQFLR